MLGRFDLSYGLRVLVPSPGQQKFHVWKSSRKSWPLYVTTCLHARSSLSQAAAKAVAVATSTEDLYASGCRRNGRSKGCKGCSALIACYIYGPTITISRSLGSAACQAYVHVVRVCDMFWIENNLSFNEE